MIRQLAVLPFLAGCVASQPATVPVTPPPAGTVTYTCDGGRTLAVTYSRENDEDIVTLNPTGEGNETLISFPVADGLQYSWPSDGSYHVWALKGGTGTLSYRDGEAGTTAPVLTNCRA
jgi:Membrane-bound lysozyme-inhibitor of c-type lysozyme